LAANGYSPPKTGRVNPSWSGIDPKQLGQIMLDHVNFANLGAVGPDLFFFLPDFRDSTLPGCTKISISSILTTVLDFYEMLYGLIDPIISANEQYLGPIDENIAEMMSQATGGLSETVSTITTELSQVLVLGLERFFLGLQDWWKNFSLGLDQGFDDQSFLWSDMLHYRATGQFARNLWKRAHMSEDLQQQAYALGYITHLATDVTGHGFVNMLVGGPYRLHWQRHHLIENHMDSLWYLSDPMSPRMGQRYTQLTESALYFDIAFGDMGVVIPRPAYTLGSSLREVYNRRRDLDQDTKFPMQLADLLIGAMKDTWYPDSVKPPAHPLILDPVDGRPTRDQIKEAYDLFYQYLKYATIDGFSFEPPDPPQLFPNLDPPLIPDLGPPPDASDQNLFDDILDFLLAVISLLILLPVLAAYAALATWAVVANVATYPARIAAYYAFILPLFQIMKSFRGPLVMAGYLMPMQDEIAMGLVTVGNTMPSMFQQVLAIIDGDVFGGMLPPTTTSPTATYRDPAYPHSIPLDLTHRTNEYKTPWSYPAPSVVQELHVTNGLGTLATTAGPYATGADPTALFGNTNTDPTTLRNLESATDPGHTDAADAAVMPNTHLGDSDIFDQYLIWLETRDNPQTDGTEVPVVDWNLDADPGYGYHDWDWVRQTSAVPQPDPERNNFFEPCTWPPQSDNTLDPLAPGTWDSTVPLDIQWWTHMPPAKCPLIRRPGPLPPLGR
jgi:hypothetical protein